ncbi:MAG: synthase subunit gamma [Candidatus Parcubacteria bacterium]|jgi:F-type H+-transporting ATPase subunit gamma
MALRDIKSKIKAVDRTRKVTKAMESVSAVKMRKSQIKAMSGRPYARAALTILERVSPALKTARHPLTETRTMKRAALIVVTSDKGLCGVLNAAVLKEFERRVIELGLDRSNIDVYSFGRKGAEHASRRGHTLRARYDNVSDSISVSDLETTVREVASEYEKGTYDRVEVVYTNFYSTFEQRPVSETILPLRVESFRNIVTGIAPTKGALSDVSRDAAPVPFYTVEPSPESVISVLLPQLISVFVYHMLLEGKASEHSARMVAMKNASDKSREVSKLLTRTYNKLRQAAITREVSEIVGGIEAMAKN